ncbi:MAG TPA: tRNA (adenosine(37)-N6)-threonylcarbamoyltransferase complex dimerization subunit type 1 TsaB [Methylibium sp.]|uniref:tRNA (adenosine(37)-N6)-threonylcarbamoyltransferase complex dimerization subunit type 1 TsaB n=1 Tax=Methylibium sp. TaxID=2067992 RepID=UPI002DBCC86F|nr:tRNA (adenosine(37)-N6)-threonylcarbamoyltransferase complex dimerization subunit type 1 TsaB [Methylibium sp.]HEU4458739.1 tRNA (adenosine(37)-N6)-threonylcarbamoyltransferase complex dimerization subunit type 1 TsaB [Methylibium sp.]
MNDRAAHAPCLLAMDTASGTLHLGLLHDDVVRSRALPGGALASTQLLPALQALLAEAGLGWRALDAIAFGRGPGAFTGVRTACAVAQGLAFGAGKPVIAIDTLAAIAEAAHQGGAGSELWVAIDARMGEAYAARYRRLGPGSWLEVEAPALHAPAALAARIAGASAETGALQVAGSSLLAHAAAWSALDRVRWPHAVAHGAALLALARGAWSRGLGLDAAEALPLYVRDKVAQTAAERAAAAA